MKDLNNDFDIMRLRTLASLRGATPAEIQRNVMFFEQRGIHHPHVHTTKWTDSGAPCTKS